MSRVGRPRRRLPFAFPRSPGERLWLRGELWLWRFVRVWLWWGCGGTARTSRVGGRKRGPISEYPDPRAHGLELLHRSADRFAVGRHQRAGGLQSRRQSRFHLQLPRRWFHDPVWLWLERCLQSDRQHARRHERPPHEGRLPIGRLHREGWRRPVHRPAWRHQFAEAER